MPMGEGKKNGPLDNGPGSYRSTTSITDAAQEVNSEGVAGKFPDIQVPPHLTDLGNAQHLVTAFGASIRYCWPWGKWLIWNGLRWKCDDTGLIHRRAKETVRLMYILAGGPDGVAAGIDKNQAKHAMRSESVRALNAMADLARSEPSVPILPNELDTALWKLNTTTGTIDLKTGNLNPHDKKDLITKVAGVEFDEDAKCPRFLEFLNQIFDGNQDLIQFVQRAGGYSLTGSVREDAFFFLQGEGANGKTTLLNVFLHVLGDYGKQASPDLLMYSRQEKHLTRIASLFGSRLTVCSEVAEGQRLNESLVNSLTGGSPRTVRRMREDEWTYEPTDKIWLDANHRPAVKSTVHAIWRRIKLIPFTVVIPDEKQDLDLEDKLKEEGPGILNWLLWGCLDWQEGGLRPPREVIVATADYRTAEDTIRRFLDECCVASGTSSATAKALYTRYKGWCEETGERVVTQQMFGRKLTEHGFVSERKREGKSWIGIGLEGELWTSEV